ncbi:acyl-CoA carboxylase subunit epsilon [Nocardioides sp. Bht2]|uniref:acyl-CoA carboxylase subunit epsilon n=1 Tax=Nocardioides sp. Bht2 TaxID=3392297 RepID=UPI0039B4CEED
MADQTNAEETTAAPAAPLLRVVNADATPEEIAAIVAVFSALGSGAAPAPKRRTPEWSRPVRRHRAAVSHGAGGWRSSGLPR